MKILKGLIYALLPAFIIIGCTSITIITRNDSGNKKVILSLPDGDYHQSIILVDDKKRDNIYIFSYSDSSILYINNAKTHPFPNYENIRSLDSEDSALRLQHEESIIEVN